MYNVFLRDLLEALCSISVPQTTTKEDTKIVTISLQQQNATRYFHEESHERKESH